MTTFTTEDRIIAEKDGSYTLNVEGGTVTASPPHIVDSGASVINNEPVAWMERKINLLTGESIYSFKKAQPEIGDIPLYIHPVKELTDEEILSLTGFKDNPYDIFIEYEKEDLIDFARAILRKAQEK
jgi:hypothetical protein